MTSSGASEHAWTRLTSALVARIADGRRSAPQRGSRPGRSQPHLVYLAGAGAGCARVVSGDRRDRDGVGMDPDRRGYLRHLAGLPDLGNEGGHPAKGAYVGARRLLVDLEPIPACVVDHRSFILDWNQKFRTLWGNPGSLPADERNVVRMFFTWPVYLHLRNYEAEARLVVAGIRNFPICRRSGAKLPRLT